LQAWINNSGCFTMASLHTYRKLWEQMTELYCKVLELQIKFWAMQETNQRTGRFSSQAEPKT